MAKCREAFEQIPEIQKRLIYLYFDEGRLDYFSKPYSQDFRFVNLIFVRGAWLTWQSLQTEINQLQSQINEMAEVGLNQESVIREKDKRIEELENLMKMQECGANKIYEIAQKGVRKTGGDYYLEKIIDLLRGEHE